MIVKGDAPAVTVGPGNERKIPAAGDGYYVKPNTVHGVVALEEGIIFDAFCSATRRFPEMRS
jgi:quercetin dioxygenase-like cupin family protein